MPATDRQAAVLLWLTAAFAMIATTDAAAAQELMKLARDPYVGAIVADADSGRVFFEDSADAIAYPASTLKLMTLLLTLEKIAAGGLNLNESVLVSAEAERMGGTQVWLKKGEVFSVDDLLYAMMIRSANDAAVALAEHVAGSRNAFVAMMNDRAGELGMIDTRFYSPHGLPPGPGQKPDVATARDMMILAREVLKHPDAIRYASERERVFRNGDLIMRTHNRLLSSVEGCDGLKTGFFSAAGFSIIATAKRGGTRIIAVVLGSASSKLRDAVASELLEKGFSLAEKAEQ